MKHSGSCKYLFAFIISFLQIQLMDLFLEFITIAATVEYERYDRYLSDCSSLYTYILIHLCAGAFLVYLDVEWKQKQWSLT